MTDHFEVAPPTGLEADVGGAVNAQGRGAEEQGNGSTVSGESSPKTKPSVLAMAQWYAKQGLRVHPLRKHLKKPMTQWKKTASTDPKQIARWFTETDSNLGVVATPVAADQCLIVIDVDVKEGKDGRVVLANLERENGTLPATFRVDTPSAGYHLYFWYDHARHLIPNSANGGLDIRANGGGYAVGAGSHLEASADDTGKQSTGDYVVAHRAVIAWLPEVWCRLLAGAKQSTESGKKKRHQDTPPPRQDQQWDDTRDALRFLNAADQGTWVDVGFCLAGTFGESGWALFEEWSLTAPASYEASENRTRWLSFFPSTKTVASIFQLAAENGWQNPAKRQPTGGNQQQGNAQRGNAVKNDTEHPIPQPLPPDLPPVLPFDYDYLPDSLGAWVQDVARRMSAPPDFIVIALLVALGATIGRRIAIRPKEFDSWTVLANLWGLMIGRPSMKKSPSLSAVLKFTKRMEAKFKRIYDEQLDAYQYEEELAKIQKDVAKAKIKKALSSAKAGTKEDVSAEALRVDKPDKPILQRLSSNSFTAAALTEILQENPNGVMGIRDEIMGLIKEVDQDGNGGLRELLLEAWNGDGQHTTDRADSGRGKALTATLSFSLIGGTQPGKIADYMRSAVKGGAGDDGLIQRFGLMVWPDQVGYDWCDEKPDKALEAELHRMFQRLNELIPTTIGAKQDVDELGEPDGLPYLNFDYEAQTDYKEWDIALNTRLRGDDIHPAMESHLMKYTKLVPALALIFHLVEVERGAVGAVSLARALAMAEYLETHAARAYASVTMGKVVGAKTLLGKIKAQKLGNPFRARDITKAGWTGFDKETTDEALDLLVDYGWLEEHESDTSKGGRPTTEYYLNPLAEGLL